MQDPSPHKALLYQRIGGRAEELAMAAAERHGGWPADDDVGDFLDFAALEWVDAEGWTEAERVVAEGAAPAAVARWSREVQTALWVVDGWEGDEVLLRDAATETEMAVYAPGRQAELPRRAVTRARVIPWDGRYQFSGAPDVWEPMGVVARLDLLRAWQEGPEPALLGHLRRLRVGFLRQREDREGFIALFGRDLVVTDSPEAMADALERLALHLLEAHPVPSLGGRTRAQAWRDETGKDPVAVSYTPGASLSGPGRHGIVYDLVEGIHFLPDYGDFVDHLTGVAAHPEVVRRYLEDPGITALPFRRVGQTAALARLLGRPDAPLDELLRSDKDLTRRATPSVLPGYDD